jgi:hypothetical protein
LTASTLARRAEAPSHVFQHRPIERRRSGSGHAPHFLKLLTSQLARRRILHGVFLHETKPCKTDELRGGTAKTKKQKKSKKKKKNPPEFKM